MAEKFPTARGAAVGGFTYPLQLLRETFGRGRDLAIPLAARPELRRIGLHDLREALARGWNDFAGHRTDVMFLCLLYPVLGLVLSRAAIGYGVLPLLFPLAAGFALVGPLAGTGLYEMSRRLEAGEDVSWRTAFKVLYTPGFGPIVLLGLLFAALFVIWLQAALAIYQMFLGSIPPASAASFLHDVFATAAGWRMIIVGNLVGLVFAVVAFALGVVSFPMLIDGRFGRSAGERLSLAVLTSLRAVARNPVPMAVWGLIVAASLVVGSVPFFLGLVVVMPVLGHATWHLYRRLIV
jgi:uncharacterized membrane protein